MLSLVRSVSVLEQQPLDRETNGSSLSFGGGGLKRWIDAWLVRGRGVPTPAPVPPPTPAACFDVLTILATVVQSGGPSSRYAPINSTGSIAATDTTPTLFTGDHS